MSLSTPRFDTVRLQVLRRLAVEKGTRRTFSSLAKTLGYLGINVEAARERLQKSWVSTQRLDHDSYLEVMLDLLTCTPVESPLEEEEKTTASSPRFEWPVVEMAQYEIMLERESGSRIDVDNVLVLTGLPKFKEAGTLRAFMLNVLSRTGIAAPVLCTFPKDSSTGALKGIVFLALPSAEDASRALNLFTRRILWPSHSPTLTVQTLLDALEEQTPFDSFDLWRGRFFRQFQSQHSYSYSPPKSKSARKRKGALRSLYRIEKQLHQKLADRSILSRHQWKTAEEALVSALDVNSASLLEAVRLAVENHVALLTALTRTAGDDYEDDKPEHLVLLEEVQQILADLIGVSTSEAPQIYAATTSILSLSLVSLAVEQNECKREAEERLMMASTQVSEHLQELSLMDVKCTELDEARRVLEEKVRILDRQLKISEEHRIKALSDQTTCRPIDKAQRSMGELMQMGDGELLTILADLDSHVSKVRTARDQVLARQHAENSLCCVCRDREKTILLLPCRHLCACAFCAASLGDCPVCRCPIRDKIGVFSS